MGAPKGNEYYKLRSKDGRDCIFQTPEEFRDAINGYFEWIEANPFKEQQLFAFQGSITKDHAEKMRPMTITGMCNYIDIAVSTFQEYEKKKDFSAIATRAKQIIETQQFEGAASGFLNPSIIARKLGLSEKTEGTVTNINVEVSKEEVKAIAASLRDEV